MGAGDAVVDVGGAVGVSVGSTDELGSGDAVAGGLVGDGGAPDVSADGSTLPSRPHDANASTTTSSAVRRIIVLIVRRATL